MAPCLLKQLCIFVDLAADDRAQPGHDVAADPATAYDNSKALPFDLAHPVTGDILRCYHQHYRLQLWSVIEAQLGSLGGIFAESSRCWRNATDK